MKKFPNNDQKTVVQHPPMKTDHLKNEDFNLDWQLVPYNPSTIDRAITKIQAVMRRKLAYKMLQKALVYRLFFSRTSSIEQKIAAQYLPVNVLRRKNAARVLLRASRLRREAARRKNAARVLLRASRLRREAARRKNVTPNMLVRALQAIGRGVAVLARGMLSMLQTVGRGVAVLARGMLSVLQVIGRRVAVLARGMLSVIQAIGRGVAVLAIGMLSVLQAIGHRLGALIKGAVRIFCPVRHPVSAKFQVSAGKAFRALRKNVLHSKSGSKAFRALRKNVLHSKSGRIILRALRKNAVRQKAFRDKYVKKLLRESFFESRVLRSAYLNNSPVVRKEPSQSSKSTDNDKKLPFQSM